MRYYIDIINEAADNKDHQRAISCLNQIVNGTPPTDRNAELLRNDAELLVIDALKYGEFTSEDEKAIKRIRISLADAYSYSASRKAEIVDNMMNMLTRFV